METIYLVDNGLLLKRKSNRIVLKKDGKIVEEIPILDLKRIVIFGNNQLSTELMRYLAGRGIEVAFLSSTGRFKFRVVPETSKNIYLRMAQHDRYRDSAFRVSISRTIVKAKIKNQRSLLVRYQRNRSEVDLKKSLDALKNLVERTEQPDNIDGLMGVEGIASKTYFEAYGKLLAGGFEFSKREYYPAPDPVNALLSFGYMLLFNEFGGLLEACGFDIFLGFLHSTKYGRASLSTDMMEDLRSPVIDRLVLYLVNKGAIKSLQFSEVEGKKGARMDDAARKTFLSNYEKFMTARFLDSPTGNQTCFREVVKAKVLGLERAVLNRAEYMPYVFNS